MAQAVLAAFCLAVVLLLVVGAARLAKRSSLWQRQANGGAPIAVLGTIALDRTYRLHMVDVSGQRMLVLTGGAGAMLPVGPPK